MIKVDDISSLFRTTKFSKFVMYDYIYVCVHRYEIPEQPHNLIAHIYKQISMRAN